MIYYQDKYCYYFRKPAGIPSSFWKEKSFLDILLEEKANTIVQSLFAFFWKEKELWLLNRLDNETTWLLYFAKNPRVYKQFKEMQSAFLIHKYYIAEVYGDVAPLIKSRQQEITFPIAHHRYNPDRMVVVENSNDINKTKWTHHYLTTTIVEFQFFPTSNTSILLICIQKGIRHQIRAHLASVGYPICWDFLYSKSKHTWYQYLQLYSIGLKTD